MSKSQKNTAEVLVECLEAHGVKYIFGVPGEETLDFLEAIRKSQRNSKITFITTRHEQTAVFMAATFGRITGKVGVALSTLGPGATNLMTGVAYAQLGGFPLLVITGQKPIRKSKQGKFQIVDIVSMMKPVTKFSASVVNGDDVPQMFSEAVSLAEAERPGVAHLELPEDIAGEVCNAKPIPIKKIIPETASAESITEAVKEIEKAKHPLVILGAGANRQPIQKELKTFFQKTGIPFVSTQMGKGGFDENSPLYIGGTGIAQGDFAHLAFKHADAIILIGHDVINTPPIILTPESLPKCKVIHINFFSSVAKDVYIPTHEIIGDIKISLSALTEKIKKSESWDFNYFYKVREASKKDVLKFGQSADFPLRPEKVVADIGKVLSKSDILALDNGMYKIYITRSFVTRERNGLLLDNALATMGAGLPSGIALKILYLKKKVLVVAGDGGIMMSIPDLETAVRLKVNLTVLILDDSGFGMIAWKQKKLNMASFGLSFNNPDFIMLAESFGAVGHKVDKAQDLAPLLKKALNSKGVHIIACPINYQEANKILGSIKNLEASY
ncbi:acetolactate synthase [Candidatus Nomurabacteria bacterium RIFCSPLOWO2_02_FULL_40_10]|uniref:Acetolactate synthase n=2 Tax=Candidatus Nomuraibacteriota TaxID=1752729 RepID=A0A1F6Y0M7_9BACT|nr:MAG: acetolactate synthase [Candidatus Nomurabacteria bacterium RIFCSPHIGHO2_01_FULL_39_10]OGI99930.1 MAG: acetolactate synthase [Candidatus Nomurabacteria bacterium RIFCSPLOWO2_02_FULL_40_10]